MRKMVLSLVVDNTTGILSRISGLFSRRGYSIDSMTAGTTKNMRYCRMTVVATGEEEILEQIQKQLAKLEDVVSIKELPSQYSVTRELILLKVAVKPEERQQIISIVDIFRAKIIDVAENSLMIELTGNEDKIEAFIELLKQYQILEMTRTGIAGLSRGAADEK